MWKTAVGRECVMKNVSVYGNDRSFEFILRRRSSAYQIVSLNNLWCRLFRAQVRWSGWGRIHYILRPGTEVVAREAPDAAAIARP